MSLEALKAKLQQVQAEAKIAIASIGAHEHLAQVEDGDGEDGKAEGVGIRAAVDLSLDGEGDNPALAVDLSQDGEGEDGGGERDRRRALPSVVDLAKDGEGDGGGEGDVLRSLATPRAGSIVVATPERTRLLSKRARRTR